MRTRNLILKGVAQLTGLLVMAIIVIGTNMDVRASVTLGVVLGAVAIFFVALSQERAAYRAKWERD